MKTTARRWALRAALAWGVLAGSALLAGCDRRDDAPAAPASDDAAAFRVLAGSELKDVAPALEAAAAQAGVPLKLSYAGTLDIVERINGGEAFDAILPANGAYPALALRSQPLAREKLFYSRVALGVKRSQAAELGWDRQPPTWGDIAAAVKAGRLRYGMTNPSSSNTGMSALFAVASAVAKKNEDLNVDDVQQPANVAAIKDFLAGQKLTAGSSGWLADAYVKEQDQLDGLVNYEAVILRLNARTDLRDKLALIYPQDGVISADYPLMLLNEARRADYGKLVAAFKGAAFQGEALAAAFLRPSSPDVAPAAALPQAAVAELSFPNRLEVIDAVLLAYQGSWRRPATSIYVLDTSGSMEGERIEQLKSALKVLTGTDPTSLTARYARFQTREKAVLIAFADRTRPPRIFAFEEGQDAAALNAELREYVDRQLVADGGTAIYSALAEAYRVARNELASQPDRVVTIALLTDGDNTEGLNAAAFERVAGTGARVRVFPILFGDSNSAAMERVAELTGGRVFDGRKGSLSAVFKDIRGYQ